jgi:hypothetical protein
MNEPAGRATISGHNGGGPHWVPLGTQADLLTLGAYPGGGVHDQRLAVDRRTALHQLPWRSGEAHSQMSQFFREVTRLSLQIETEQFLNTQALRITSDLAQAHFQMYVLGTSELPPPFLVKILAGVEQGKLLAALTAVATADRETAMDFSHPYYSSGLAIAVPVRATSGNWFEPLGCSACCSLPLSLSGYANATPIRNTSARGRCGESPTACGGQP